MKSFFSSVLERASSSYTAWKEGDGGAPDSPGSPGDDSGPGSPENSGYRYRSSLYVMSFSGKNKGGTPDENSTPQRRSRLELMAHPDVILAAAHSLSDAIQDILSDTANLAGDNMQGFQRLIDVLESPQYSTDINEIRASKGLISAEVLLVNREHPLFSDMCNQISLCTNLLHAFRLLRMYEIKTSSAPPTATAEAADDAEGPAKVGGSATLAASYRLSRIFGVLIHDPSTIEKMKNSLVKLLVFPLTVLPANGVHLQEHASYVVSQMCSACLTAEQVWYLHEVQAVTLMIRHLAQLMLLSDGDAGKDDVKADAIVRGLEGERRGMWLVGIKVLVQVITSSVSVSPKLMEDFESGGGVSLMVDFLQHTSADNLLEALSAYSLLFFDASKKEDDALAYPRIGAALEDLLFIKLRIAKSFHMDGLNDFLSGTCLLLLSRRADVAANEALVQNVAYLLLTMYSNCARAAVVLESTYYYVPKLLLCVPSMANEHSISAVLTLANYICQCHDGAATVTIISLCIVTSIIINSSLDAGSSAGSLQLSSTISACDAILRCNRKFALIVLRGGLLRELVHKPLSRLQEERQMRLLDGGEGDLEVYLKVVDLLLALSRRSSSIADEIRKAGMHDLILALVNSSRCQLLTARLLLVFECFARASRLHLNETLASVITVVNQLKAAHAQLLPVLRCLTNIMKSCADAAATWKALEGWALIFGIVRGMAGHVGDDSASQCLAEVLSFLAAYKSARRQQGGLGSGLESLALLQELRSLNTSLVAELVHAEILTSEAYAATVDMLLAQITIGGFDPSSVELLLLLLPHLPSERATGVVHRADRICRQVPADAQLLSEAGSLQLLMERFQELLLQSTRSSHASDGLSSALLSFLGSRMKRYLSLPDFKAFFSLVLKHVVGRAGYESLPPWEAGGSDAPRAEDAPAWDPLQLLLDFGASSSCHGVPFVTLGGTAASSSGSGGSAACLSVNMSELSSKAFSLASFSCSQWLQMPESAEGAAVVALLSFASAGSALVECILEHGAGATVVTVVCKKQGALALLQFKAPVSIDLTRWTLIVVSYSKQKLLPFSKGKVTVTFNGLRALPLDSDNADVEVPASNAGLVLCVGRSALDLPRALPQLAPQCARLPSWQLGPLQLYDEVLSAQQVGALFLRGPARASGVVRSSAPQQPGDYAAAASRALLACDQLPLAADEYLELLGFSGLIEVVEPVIDQPTAGRAKSVDLAAFAAQPVLAYSALNTAYAAEPSQGALQEEGELCFEEEGSSRPAAAPALLLLNSVHSHSRYSRPVAVLESAGLPCVAYSLPACIAACGGPAMLLPLVQAASVAPTLHRALRLIGESVRGSDYNRRWMQGSGYKLLSYVLSIKPTHLLDTEVVKLLFDMCQSESVRGGGPCLLLVDTAALYYLPLNHQIWSSKRFAIASEVVRRVVLLCSDARYGPANARRMSCVGVLRWALLLAVHGVRQEKEAGAAGDWAFASLSSADMAREPERAQKDAFLSNVATVVYLLLRVDVRKRDVDLIASIIAYALSVDASSRTKLYSVGSAQELREELRLSRASSRAPSIDSYSDAEPALEGGELSGLGVLRVLLLRAMITLLEECSASAPVTGGPFRQAFTTEWFLNAIENSSDEAALSNVLRLLGLAMQRDAALQRDFCHRDGLKFIALHVSSYAQAFSMALPLVAMLLRLPMASVPYPGTVCSLSGHGGCAALVHLLADDCDGPDAAEPALSEFTTPLLKVVLECLAARVRAAACSSGESSASGSDSAPAVDAHEEAVLGLLEYAFETMPSFRQLMQTRPAVELLSLCVVQCSNGHEEYGIHTYSSGSLTSALRDEYVLSRPSSGMATERVIADEHAAVSTSAGYVALEMGGSGGARVAALISSSMRAGLQDHRNPCILQHYLLAFPQALAPMYIQSFQLMVMRRFSDEVSRCWPAADGLAACVGAMLHNLTAALPLVKARVLYPCVQVEALSLSLELFARVSSSSASPRALQIAGDKLQALVRDAGLTLRCYVSASMGALLRQSVLPGDQRARLLARLRSLLKFLLAAQAYDDAPDSVAKAPRVLGSHAPDRPALQVLDMFAVSLDVDVGKQKDRNLLLASSSDKKSSDNAAMAAERSKLSQSFCVALSYYCLLLATEPEERVALEAGRILSVLALARRPVLEQVLRLAAPAAPAKKQGFAGMAFGGDDRSAAAGPLADFSEELFSRLVLQPQADFEKYAGICLREVVPFGKDSSGNGVSFANSDEERLRAFSAWLRGSAAVYEEYLLPLEQHLRHLLPPTSLEATYTESSRQVQAFKLHALRSSMASSSHALESMQRVEDRAKHRDVTLQNVHRFRVFGLLHIASGAFQWKNVWTSLAAGALWGRGSSLPAAVAWRLDQAEGPERTRRRMEQCSGIGAREHCLRQGGTAPSEADELTSNETTRSEDDQLETLLKEIAKTGPRPTMDCAAVEAVGGGEEEALEEALQEALQPQLPEGAGAAEGFDGDALLHASLESLQDRESDSRSSSPDSASSKGRVSDGLGGQESHPSTVLLEVLKGVVGAMEWPTARVFNVDRIYGLQDHAAVLVLTASAIHIIGNVRLRERARFELVSPGGEEVAAPLRHGTESARLAAVWRTLLGSDLEYYSTQLSQVYSVFRRRHQLKATAIEIVDTSGFPVLFAAGRVEECNKILSALFQAELPSSLFHKTIGIKNLELLRGVASIYNRLLSLFVARLTRMWQQGELSNFEYLIHLNTAAGRSYQDLTQYPVFPWVIADYSSDSLDLADPAVYRDLSKPMGALGERRCKQYGERFRTMNEFWRDGVEGSPPPFHYGTHYSCAGYVLHYLIRMQPYTDSAVSLQGGHFDKPDRLFHSIESSWRSASQENLQDVRELIPEFFYLPEFLKNSNNFDLGCTQRGEAVGDVVLPRWARGDAHEFVRINRQALESRHVSEHLHHWIDLIFGCKQRGAAAEAATNVFIHVTYDGEVDIDAISDPVLRSATIAQINNFGQTPTKLFNKPHPRRYVPDVGRKGASAPTAGGYSTLEAPPALSTDSHALTWHQNMAPPLTSLSAGGEFVRLHKTMHSAVPFLGSIKHPAPVADAQLLSRDRLVVVPFGHAFLGSAAKAVARFGGPSGGLTLHSRKHLLAQRNGDSDDRECVVYEHLHSRRIGCVTASPCGKRFATGSEDASIGLWRLSAALPVPALEAAGTLCGHSAAVLCLDFAAELELLVSGSADGAAALWDTRRARLVRVLGRHAGPVLSVSISPISGYVLTLARCELRLYSLNGDLLAAATLSLASPAGGEEAEDTVPQGSAGPDILAGGLKVLAVPTADWQRGLVAVTGHENGFVYIWKLRVVRGRGEGASLTRTLVPHALAKTHAADITLLKLCSTLFNKQRGAVQRAFDNANCCDLLVGDADGQLTRYRAEGGEEAAGGAASSTAGTIFKRIYAAEMS